MALAAHRGRERPRPADVRLSATSVTLIAAVARNGVIGADGAIPWHLPEDLAHFRATTLGHTVVMGRVTYESIGRPLPGRRTIVLTRDPAWSAAGVVAAAGLDDALALAEGRVYVAGGAAVYAAALPLAGAQIVSEVDLAPDGDTRHPAYPPDRARWREVTREPHPDCTPAFTVVTWHRRGGGRR